MTRQQRFSAFPSIALTTVLSMTILLAGCARNGKNYKRIGYRPNPVPELDLTTGFGLDDTASGGDAAGNDNNEGVTASSPQEADPATGSGADGLDRIGWNDGSTPVLPPDLTDESSGFTPGSAANPIDTSLSLFGEVDGVAGIVPQMGADENVWQVSFATEGSDFEPDVDSLGQYVVYASTQHTRSEDLYVKAVEGQTVRQLTNDPARDMMPAYSPDNRQIVFASDRNGNFDIFVMDSGGGTAVQITDSPAPELHPSWSPDGRFIVYCRLGEQSGRWEMWVTEFGNTAVRNFIGYGLFPEWSPDPLSGKILFQRARERGSRLFGIWTIDFANGQGTRPTEIVSASNAAAINPSWSADGRMIVFSTIIDPHLATNGNEDLADLWVVNLDGSGKANLTNGHYRNLHPTWSPDGRIFFQSNRSYKDIDNIWSVSPDRPIRTARGPNDSGPTLSRGATNNTAVAEVPDQ